MRIDWQQFWTEKSQSPTQDLNPACPDRMPSLNHFCHQHFQSKPVIHKNISTEAMRPGVVMGVGEMVLMLSSGIAAHHQVEVWASWCCISSPALSGGCKKSESKHFQKISIDAKNSKIWSLPQIFVLRMCCLKVLSAFGLWLWRSWQSGRVWHQRAAVWIPTSSIKYIEQVYLSIAIQKRRK